MTGSQPSEADEDDVLFRLMAAGHRHPELARAAWSTLFHRYDERLSSHVRRCYARVLGGDAGVRDLVHEVWVRAYERAETYAAVPAEASDPTTQSAGEVESWTMGWLRSIARSVHFDQVRVARRSHVPQRGTGEPLRPKPPTLCRHGPDDVPSNDDRRYEVICELLAELPERDRDVLHVSFLWYGLEDKECRIPREEVGYLKRRWHIDEAYIRQIRRRVLKKVEVRLQQRALGLSAARTA
jgi:DNA-directed RNA polymerase specialized sigma24 family protein